MLTLADQEKLVGDILRASIEVLTLDELGKSVLPLLERTFDTSASLLYHCNSNGKMQNIAGTQVAANYEYLREHYFHDPMQPVMRRSNPWIFHGSRHPEWQEMIKLPVYEFSLREGIDDYILLRLTDTDHDAPGMAAILLARSHRQPKFSERDELLLARALPALEALARRSARLAERLQVQPCLEAVLESGGLPKIALDLNGSLLWASEFAKTLVSLRQGGQRAVPDVLVHAARQLGMLYRKTSNSVSPRLSVAVPRKDAAPIRAELRVARTPSGAPFAIAEFESPEMSPILKEVAARYRLSATETEVLSLLSQGLADKQIGRRLFVSMPTVRTHVGQILAKLEVHSRIQAALIARGILLPELDDDEK